MNNFDEYFQRVGVAPSEPTIELVDELISRHIATFSFNSMAVLLGKEISIEINDIYKKIVLDNHGGYCFEHNRLMHDVLKSLGFNVRLLVARVINNLDIDSPRTHRVTLLEFEGDNYLVDVGFGAKGQRASVRIEDGYVSIRNGGNYRIVVNQHSDYQLETETSNGYFSLYTFNFNRYTEADCVMGNFYSYVHPKATFVNNLVFSRILPDMTLSLRNKEYHRIGKDSTEIIKKIDDAKQLQQIIKDDFGVSVTDEESEILYQKANAV